MAQNHEDLGAELHEEFNSRKPSEQQHDAAGGYITHPVEDEKSGFGAEKSSEGSDIEAGATTADGDEPNEWEKKHLRRVGENLPASAFLIAASVHHSAVSGTNSDILRRSSSSLSGLPVSIARDMAPLFEFTLYLADFTPYGSSCSICDTC